MILEETQDVHVRSVPSAEVYNTASCRGWSDLPRVPCPRSNVVADAINNEMNLLDGYYATSSGFIGSNCRMIEY